LVTTRKANQAKDERVARIRGGNALNRLPTTLENNRRVGLENPPSVNGDRNQVETADSCSPSRFESPASEQSQSTSEVVVECAALARRGFTQAQHQKAETQAQLCQKYIQLTDPNGPARLSGNQAAATLGKAASWFSTNLKAYKQRGADAFLPKPAPQKPAEVDDLLLPPWFIAAAQFYYLLSNRTRETGSVPEAIRRTISLPAHPPALRARLIAKFGAIPECPEELRETILAREREGKPLLTPRLMKAIAIAAPFVKRSRNKTESNLEHLSAPGSQMWRNVFTDQTEDQPATVTRDYIRAGDVIEADDATINLGVCIPWTLGGCKASEKFGVKLGRFQWLRAIDVGSRKRLAYVYVVRPRASYRAEDILSLIRAVVRTHGIPKEWRFEKGSWLAKIIQDAVAHMGSKLWTVNSPRQKPFVEGGFNTDWTKLSIHFPDAHVGRFQGENETANKLYTQCQQGYKDPRRHFPMLAEVLQAMDQITAEENRTLVKSANYGQWIPNERWENHTTKNPLRQLDPATDWIFNPYIREATIKGMLVGCRVPLFEGFSVPFDFTAAFLPEFHGARVKMHFDPTDAQCQATIVLAQPWRGTKQGTVLGKADQINEVAAYARLAMGYIGADHHLTEAGAGRRAKQINANAMRREIRSVVGPEGHSSELRDGLGTKAILEHSSPAKDVTQGNSPEETGRQGTGPSITEDPAFQRDVPATSSPCCEERNKDQFPGHAQPETSGICHPRARRGDVSAQLSDRVTEADAWERANALNLT
jgi:hypothetical protein